MEGQSKGAVPSPVVQSLIICDEVIVDRETGKYSLIGVFDRLVAGKFPAKHPKLAIFSELVTVMVSMSFGSASWMRKRIRK
jgi:hypothetical protein